MERKKKVSYEKYKLKSICYHVAVCYETEVVILPFKKKKKWKRCIHKTCKRNMFIISPSLLCM